MPTPKRWHVIASAATLLIAGTPAVTASAGPADTDSARHGRAEWAGTWAAAVTRGNTVGLTNTGLNNQSIWMPVQTTVGGDRLRVRLTNLYGEQAVKVGHATVARPNTATADDRSDIDPASVRELTFFDPHRAGPPSLAFGVGLHFCLGSAVSKLEARLALPRLFARFPGLTVSQPYSYSGSLFLRGIDKLFVTTGEAR